MQEKKVYTSVVFSKNYLPMRRKFEEWFNVQHNVCPGPSRLVCPKQTQVPAHKAGSRQSMGGGGPHWAAKWIATNANQPNIRKEYIKTISGGRGGQHGKLLRTTDSMLFHCAVSTVDPNRDFRSNLFLNTWLSHSELCGGPSMSPLRDFQTSSNEFCFSHSLYDYSFIIS